MLEYASMRLMFRWGIANRFLTVCVAIARTAIATSQSTWIERRPTRKTLNSATMPTFFEPAARNVEIVVGAPWYTSGAPMWNGTTATLHPTPAMRKTIATRSRMIADETAPMMKNFRDASVADRSRFRNATRVNVLSELISNARYRTKRSVAAAVNIIPTTARNKNQ